MGISYVYYQLLIVFPSLKSYRVLFIFFFYLGNSKLTVSIVNLPCTEFFLDVQIAHTMPHTQSVYKVHNKYNVTMRLCFLQREKKIGYCTEF